MVKILSGHQRPDLFVILKFSAKTEVNIQNYTQIVFCYDFCFVSLFHSLHLFYFVLRVSCLLISHFIGQIKYWLVNFGLIFNILISRDHSDNFNSGNRFSAQYDFFTYNFKFIAENEVNFQNNTQIEMEGIKSPLNPSRTSFIHIFFIKLNQTKAHVRKCKGILGNKSLF